MAIEVVTVRQHLVVDGVSDVSVSAISHDDEAGDFYRDIIFFGEPEEGTSVIPTILAVRIRADTVDPLKITVPQDEF
jgi:hypothetical protein